MELGMPTFEAGKEVVMDLGMPTLIENRNLRENVELCRDVGLDFLELNMNMPMYQADEIGRIPGLIQMAEEYGIYYTIHLEENLNVCDFNEAVGGAYLDTVRKTIQIAEELGLQMCAGDKDCSGTQGVSLWNGCRKTV